MLKVLILTDTLITGGAERQLSLLIKHMPPEWECRVWSMDGGPYEAELRKAGKVLYLSPRMWRWDFLPALKLWRLIWTWRPDIVHSYGRIGTLASLVPCRWLQIPFVNGTIRRAMAPNVQGVLGRVWLWALQYGDRVIANSEAGLKAYDIDPSRGRVIYNGFDPERLQICGPEDDAYNWAEPFRVVMAARMHFYKDYDLFIQAARILTEYEGCAWKFLAIGDGPRYNTLVEDSADLIARNTLSFTREEMEVLPYVRQANVGVLLTESRVHQEGCSNSIMEYMACGLPVVCSDSGGNRELVLDGVTGFIVPPHDVNALVVKLQWLKTHPQEAQAMGMAGRQRLIKEYGVEKLVEKTLSVYAELLPETKSQLLKETN